MRIYAWSDIHVGHPANRALVEALPPRPNDALALAGDVADTESQFTWALQELSTRFATVLWCPGNHELWTLPGSSERGLERYESFVARCRELGVVTPEDGYPWLPIEGAHVLLAPVFTLYDYSFRPPGSSIESALATARARGVVCADEHYLHPDPYPSRQEWCAARVGHTRRRLEEAAATVASSGGHLVLMSHFPLRRDVVVLPRMPEFAIWCGTEKTETWHTEFGASMVISGHLHTPGTKWRDGVRFEEVSLGHPREWQRGPRTVPRPRLVWPPPDGRIAGGR